MPGSASVSLASFNFIPLPFIPLRNLPLNFIHWTFPFSTLKSQSKVTGGQWWQIWKGKQK
jgi:hypothetical protein